MTNPMKIKRQKDFQGSNKLEPKEEYVVTNYYEEDKDLVCISPLSKDRKSIVIGLGIIGNLSLLKKDYNIIGEWLLK